MTTVIVFQPSARRARRERPSTGEAAEILLFTGVRYERVPERIDLAERLTPIGPDEGRTGGRPCRRA